MASRKAGDHLPIVIGGHIEIDREELDRLLTAYHVASLSVFGSAARDTLTDSSDVDLLVEFKVGMAPSLSGLLELRGALSRLMGGIKVDLATKSILANPYRRRSIAHDLRILHAA